MILSEATIVSLGMLRARLRFRLAGLFSWRRPTRRAAPYQYDAFWEPDAAVLVAAMGETAADGTAGAADVTVSGTLAPCRADGRYQGDDLTANERRARVVALRGLTQARQHRFEEARALFAEAVELDPALDLARIPTFWDLPRGAQQAAIEAYEQVGRMRDAAALTATARSFFRPKAVRTRLMRHEAVPEP